MNKFDYFVVFAEMRTGSNFLEANINAFDGLMSHGEAFNPSFVGYPNKKPILGITKEDRDRDPFDLLTRIKDAKGLNGFRFFNNHEPRVLDDIVADPRCGKIILTRNPLESYVSWKIAKATGQWALRDVKRRREQTIKFDGAEFESKIAKLQSFRQKLLNALQKTGQSAFHLDYDDLQDVEIMNGLAAFLGIDARLTELDKSFKKQNPRPLTEKVENFEEMEAALAALDRFNLKQTQNFEPKRGASIPTFVAAPKSPLLYLPIRSGPEAVVREWLAGLDDLPPDVVLSGFNQQGLQDWKREKKGHRSFTVLRHPVARAHAVFCEKVLSTGTGSFVAIRKMLEQQFDVVFSGKTSNDEASASDHKQAFLAFLAFVKSNLSGQTSVRVDPHWASQASVVQGFADFVSPDFICREDTLADDLAILAAQIGLDAMPAVPEITDEYAAQLAQIYDVEIENVVREVYQRDYDTFGFGPYVA